MRRYMLLLAALLLAAAACGDDETPATDAPPTTAVVAETTDAPEATDAPEPTDAPATTAAATAEGDGGLVLTMVSFGDNGMVTITNRSNETVSLDGMWLCNRPQYLALSGELEAFASMSIPASDIPPLNADGGDLGLYSDADFGNPDAIVDYVAWGSGGGRLSVAVDAGIWPDGDAVATTGASIVAPQGGDSAADWSSTA